MSRVLTANEKSALVKLASALPAGSSERKRVLGLAKQAEIKVTQKDIDKAKVLSGVDPQIAKFLSETGLGDGQKDDDKIQVSKVNVAAGKLKPSQTSMVLDKSLGMALEMLLGKMPLGGDLGAIISKDNHILDGHHRWSAAILAGGPGTSVGGYKADLEGKELIKVLNIVTKGMFGRMQGNPGKGSIKEYTPENIKKTLEGFVEKGSGQFSADEVKKALEKLGGSVEEGIKEMSENVKKMSKAVPSWAPDRKEMPVIEPNEVPEVANALNQGEVNWNIPFAEKEAVLRLAALLPKGSSERRVLLAGLTSEKRATPTLKEAKWAREPVVGNKYLVGYRSRKWESVFVGWKLENGEPYMMWKDAPSESQPQGMEWEAYIFDGKVSVGSSADPLIVYKAL